MGRFTQRYSAEQKEAATSAYLDKGIRPFGRVVTLANNGQLLGKDDRAVPAFDMPESTLRSYVRDEKKKRAGRVRRDIATAEPRDAIETLRRRGVSAADHLLEGYEAQLKKDANKADPERLRQILRVIREASALPGPTDLRPPKPGARQEGGVRTEGATRTAMARGILEDIGGGEPPQNPTQGDKDTGTEPRRSAASTERTAQGEGDGLMDRLPGSLALALDARSS